MSYSRRLKYNAFAGFHLWGMAFILVCTALWTSPAEATPAFARKYGTSCLTCHIVYPKLNAYGNAFRLLGYQLPDETEDMIKQPDTKLGAEAYKRVWPDAVWPNSIPSSLPFALATEFLVRSSSEAEGGPDVNSDFLFPSGTEIIAAGTAGDNIAYFGEIAFETEVEEGSFESKAFIPHIDIRFVRLIKNSPVLNVKVGLFQPEMVVAFDHARRLTIANYDAMFGVSTAQPGGGSEVGGGGHHGGGGGISLPAVARGLEFYGVAAQRFQWSAAVVNGFEPGVETFDANSGKDLMGRIAYKYGGMALDGSNATTYTTSSKNWRERSIQVGIFGYRGDGKGVLLNAPAAHEDEHDLKLAADDPPTVVEDEDFTRVGIDFNLFFGDLNLFGAYVHGEDDLRDPTAGSGDDHEDDHVEKVSNEDEFFGTFEYDAFFLEADAVLHYPWLQGILRYEMVDFPDRDIDKYEKGIFSVVALVRANVKAIFEHDRDLNESENWDLWWGTAIAF